MENVSTSQILPRDASRPAAPVNFKAGYAGLILDDPRVNASLSRLDMMAILFAAVMALGPLAMAAWGAHFGA
jgi:hypothetical protein